MCTAWTEIRLHLSRRGKSISVPRQPHFAILGHTNSLSSGFVFGTETSNDVLDEKYFKTEPKLAQKQTTRVAEIVTRANANHAQVLKPKLTQNANYVMRGNRTGYNLNAKVIFEKLTDNGALSIALSHCKQSP